MIVVAARRALHGNPALAGVGGHKGSGIHDVSGRVDGIYCHLIEIPAAAPQSVLAVDQLPVGAGIIGEINPTTRGRRRAATSTTAAITYMGDFSKYLLITLYVT